MLVKIWFPWKRQVKWAVKCSINLLPDINFQEKVTNFGSVFFNIKRDQEVPFLWDQEPKFVTLLKSRSRNLGTKIGSAKRKQSYLVRILLNDIFIP